ncbi:MAG: adenine phosphoribosyltransferase [Melioribacteraceae bacterium]|nr:adenine phosphoribosyltransferase [Melioribacteraceae bacterium]MCF8264545.1 adenine phosphoribosyltransferase [Melioribacteraceae bacterium]
MDLKSKIRDVPNFPKEGIIFKDITTLLQDPAAFNFTLKRLVELSENKGITKVVGIESRGFIFGAALAERLGVGFVPIRKPGKLPAAKESESYILEYGSDQIEIHKDALDKDDVVLLHDDLLATGGTMKAATTLVERLGAKIAQLSFVIELSFLHGRKLFDNYEVISLIQYDSE